MKILSLILFLIIFSIKIIHPQIIDSTVIQTEETLDEILEESFEEDDNSDLFNSIEELILNPIDLNSADIFELQKIPNVTSNIAEVILSYRNRFGPFYSVNELYAMRELDRELINKIIPFLKTDIKSFQFDSSATEETFQGKSFIPAKLKAQLRSRFGNDLQTRKGFEEGIYLGSKLRAYNRLLIKYSNQIQAGIIFDKDAGEKDFNDFNSFHINAKDIGMIKNFILGDYVLEFGQGLMLWSPYSFSKGADA
ncbi:MAG: ComEA family DNA-binding protein, partial [Ignavibacterium sp.]